MKKVFVIILIFLLSAKLFAKTLLVSETPCEYRETFIGSDWDNFKSSLTYDEFMTDIDMLCYYLENAYADYDGMLSRGFIPGRLKKEFEIEYKGKENIDTRAAFGEVADYLVPFISDCHFTITSKSMYYYPLQRDFFYYTNTFVEKTDDKYCLFESDNEKLVQGMTYGGSDENLFYYPSKGKNIYRLGAVGYGKPDCLRTLFNGKDYDLPLLDDGYIQLSSIRYHELESDESVYASLSSFTLPEEDSQMRKGAEIVLERYANLASRCSDKKNIIIDLRSNPGGIQAYSEYLFYALYTGDKKEFSFEKCSKFYKWFMRYAADFSVIDSPATAEARVKILELLGLDKRDEEKSFNRLKKKPFRRSFRIKGEKVLEQSEASYKGKIIILVDRNSQSASENTVMIAKLLFGDNVIVAGEKTCGCIEIGEIYDYMLPVSKVLLHLGARKNEIPKNFYSWYGEGHGYYPDYWSLGADLNDTIFLVTGDSVMKEKLKEIDSRLL